MKRKSVAGEEHINSRRVLVPQKQIGNPCGCKKQCLEKLGDQCTQRIFKDFYTLDKSSQDSYLLGNINKHPVHRNSHEMV
jgi:hypothetical protein